MVESRLRQAILAIVVFGAVGVLAELWLIGHYEDTWQWLPMALLAAIVPFGIAAGTGGRRALIAFRALMFVCVLSGIGGQWLHYSGNAEFELEMYPDRAGMELFRESMSGATPVLAPGTMTVIGLLGLAYAWRHPRSWDR